MRRARHRIDVSNWYKIGCVYFYLLRAPKEVAKSDHSNLKKSRPQPAARADSQLVEEIRAGCRPGQPSLDQLARRDRLHTRGRIWIGWLPSPMVSKASTQTLLSRNRRSNISSSG